MDEPRNFSPNGILRHITNSRKLNDDKYTFIITGKVGPTGKSSLKRELLARGYNAIEITGSLYSLIEYQDDNNHVIVDECEKTVLIVLNRRLPMKFL